MGLSGPGGMSSVRHNIRQARARHRAQDNQDLFMACLALVLEVAEEEERVSRRRYDHCRFCDGMGPEGGTLRHDPGCLWLRAREVAGRLDA